MPCWRRGGIGIPPRRSGISLALAPVVPCPGGPRTTSGPASLFRTGPAGPRGSSMCGIVGYIGPREAEPVLLEGLRRLEYRGYDSAGIATLTGPRLHVRKKVG